MCLIGLNEGKYKVGSIKDPLVPLWFFSPFDLRVAAFPLPPWLNFPNI